MTDAETLDELRRQIEELQKKECPTCGGTGINPEYIPEKPEQSKPARERTSL